MIVLGLHFGHDAGISILQDGRILATVLRERTARIKHAMGLDFPTLQRALEAAGVALSEIDCCAIWCTARAVRHLGSNALDGGRQSRIHERAHAQGIP